MYKLSHVGIRVADMERALAFYTGALGGMRESEHRMPSGARLVFVRFEDFSVELIGKPDDDRAPGNNHLALSVPSIRDAARRLNEHGVSVPESAIAAMGAGLNCFVKGPDGEIVELCEGTL